MKALFRRELGAYFRTALGYLYLAVFLSVCGFLFYTGQMRSFSSDLTGFYSVLGNLSLLLVPALTARLLPSESRQFTDQLLFSSPLSVGSIVLAKYLAAAAVFGLGLLLSLVFPLLTAVYGRLWAGETAVAYLGLFLQGAALIAFDMMLTARAGSLSSAVFLALGGNLAFWLLSLLSDSSRPLPVRAAVGFLSPFERFVPFVYGQLSPANVLYFLGLAGFCLLACAQLFLPRGGEVPE